MVHIFWSRHGTPERLRASARFRERKKKVSEPLRTRTVSATTQRAPQQLRASARFRERKKNVSEPLRTRTVSATTQRAPQHDAVGLRGRIVLTQARQSESDVGRMLSTDGGNRAPCVCVSVVGGVLRIRVLLLLLLLLLKGLANRDRLHFATKNTWTLQDVCG